VSVAMLRSAVFHKAVAFVGIVGNVFALGNCVSVTFVSTNVVWIVVFVGVGGILSFFWWALIGLTLYRRGPEARSNSSQSSDSEA